jgi:hypothetical protein
LEEHLALRALLGVKHPGRKRKRKKEKKKGEG